MIFFAAIFLVAILLFTFYIYAKLKYNYWMRRGVVSDKPTLVFGNLLPTLLGKKSLGEIFVDLYNNYPGEKVVGWYKFQEPGLIIRDPNLARKVLVNDFHSFRNNDMHIDENIDPVLGRNIFILKDEKWKQKRALLTPAFTAGKVKGIYPMMSEIAKELVRFLKQHPEELHVKRTMSRYTAEIVAHCALGIEGNNFKEPSPRMHELGRAIFEPDLIKGLKMFTFTILPKLSKLLRLKMVPQMALDFFDSVLRDVIIYRQENNIEKKDLIQHFIEIKKKSINVANGTVKSDLITQVFSDNDILVGCVTFFIEGYETSSLTITNILYFLAKNPSVQQKLRQEIEETLKEGEITFETLHAMPLLNSVCQESSRMLPVMYALQKVCTETYEMDIGKTKPLVIEKGTSVILPIYNLQNDPTYWEDPHLFKPERFLNKEDTEARATGVYFPFGDGPRMCPGSRIAMTMVKLAVFYICSEMEIFPTSKTPEKFVPDPNYFMVAHKDGVYLRFAERHN